MSWLKERERDTEKDMLTGVFHMEKWKVTEADGGMKTLFVLYWMINMCYADMGPQGGHGAIDTKRFRDPLEFPGL